MAGEIRMASKPECDGTSWGLTAESASISAVLQELHQRYHQVDKKLEHLMAASQTDWNDKLTSEILVQVDEIQQLSSQASELARSRLDTSNDSDTVASIAQETRAAFSKQIQVIETMFRDMLGKIAMMERTVQSARDQLLPQVNVGVRALQVRRAYSGS